MGKFKYRVTAGPKPTSVFYVTASTPGEAGPVRYLQNLTQEDTLALETGYTERNEWLEWVWYTAKQTNVSNCIACASARPHLTTTPYPLDLQNSPEGLRCAVTLFHNSTGGAGPCQPFQYLYPSVSKVKPSIPHSGGIVGEINFTHLLTSFITVWK
uniref:Uncharacterized protein n=1 Tax=Mastacembelus armatus TaxID=205130 RepID=A0A7N8YHH3_9TELE